MHFSRVFLGKLTVGGHINMVRALQRNTFIENTKHIPLIIAFTHNKHPKTHTDI